MKMVWEQSAFVPTTLWSLPSFLKSEFELPKDEFFSQNNDPINLMMTFAIAFPSRTYLSSTSPFCLAMCGGDVYNTYNSVIYAANKQTANAQ